MTEPPLSPIQSWVAVNTQMIMYQRYLPYEDRNEDFQYRPTCKDSCIAALLKIHGAILSNKEEMKVAPRLIKFCHIYIWIFEYIEYRWSSFRKEWCSGAFTKFLISIAGDEKKVIDAVLDQVIWDNASSFIYECLISMSFISRLNVFYYPFFISTDFKESPCINQFRRTLTVWVDAIFYVTFNAISIKKVCYEVHTSTHTTKDLKVWKNLIFTSAQSNLLLHSSRSEQ